MRKKIASGLATVAATIALAPAKLLLKVAPDHGPGSTAYAVLAMAGSVIITLPLTFPIALASLLLESKPANS